STSPGSLPAARGKRCPNLVSAPPPGAVYISAMHELHDEDATPANGRFGATGDQQRPGNSRPNRRSFLAAALGTTALGTIAAAQGQQPPVSPTPTPRDWSKLDAVQYPDPDIVALDPKFRRYIVNNTPIRRLH